MTIRRFLNNARDITSTWGGRDFFINGRKEQFEKMVKQYVDEISQKDGEFESLYRGEYSLIETLKRRLLLVFGGLHKYRLKEDEYGWYTLKANKASLIDRTRELGENYLKMAKAAGYAYTMRLETMDEMAEIANAIQNKKGPMLFEILVSLDSRENLGRPKESA